MTRFHTNWIVLTAIAGLALSSMAAGKDSTETFQVPLGTWTGTGYQLYDMPSDGEYSSWNVLLRSDGKSIGISYPSLGCGGTWDIENSTRLASYYRENITYGVEDCIDQGLVVASPMDDGRLRLEYYYPDNTFIAFAHLDLEI